MALTPRKTTVAPETSDADTQEETAPATTAATNWESLFIIATAVFLVASIGLVLYEAGMHYGAGPFAKP
ncbi:MAG TPA: hypothetical protein VKE69_02725 [Planctomycetota bacterium]|nr:hypothetical protein [Planctomycetota bacterium]